MPALIARGHLTSALFLEPAAATRLAAMELDPLVKAHALEVVQQGYTLVKRAISSHECEEAIAAFRRFEAANEAIFAENRNQFGHYPKTVWPSTGGAPTSIPPFPMTPSAVQPTATSSVATSCA